LAPLLVLAAFVFVAMGDVAQTQDASTWRDIKTKYIFGFTTGLGYWPGRRKGIRRWDDRMVWQVRRPLSGNQDEIRFTPSQFIQIEFGALGFNA